MSIADSFEIDDVTKASHVGSLAMPSDYFALLKPRVMSLVIFTALVGMIVAPVTIHPLTGLVALLCIAIGAGASGALNMWYDADIDAVMTRTASRPIPAGKVAPQAALSFGLILSVFSVMILGLLVNWLSASLLAFTIFFYAVVYSHWLKRSTPQNIVIGGAAGAFPPMIGWAAATNSIGIESLVLFAIIFIWTPPHFWALALFKSADYEKVGVPMMPNVAGNRSTQNQILAYTILMAPLGVAPYLLGFAGLSYAIISSVLGAAFLWYAYQSWKMDSNDEQMKPAKRMFAFSIFYLFALFATLLVEALVAKVI